MIVKNLINNGTINDIHDAQVLITPDGIKVVHEDKSQHEPSAEPSLHCSSNKPSKKSGNAKKKAHPASARPSTMTYFTHENKGVLAKQQKRVNIIFKLWIGWQWIDPETSPDDFNSLFEGARRHCNIIWKTNSSVLTILLQELMAQDYIKEQTGQSAKTMVKEQFGKTPNSDRTRLKENEKRIDLTINLLDIRNPLPVRDNGYTEEEDIREEALMEVYGKNLRCTKGI